MPEIASFFGIKITMYYDDHNPPHFHAEYAGNKALVDIENGYIIRGTLPNRQLKFVLAWTELHKTDLLDNWKRAEENMPLQPIAPLM